MCLPRLEKRPLRREFHGDVFTDEYEWIRNDEEAMLRQLRAENKLYDRETESLAPLRARLTAEIASHVKTDDVSVPVRHGSFWYWSRTWEEKNYPAVYRCAAQPAGHGGVSPVRPDPHTVQNATLVYDGNLLAEDSDFFGVGDVAYSPDGRLCALETDSAGNETFQIRIHEIDSGLIVDDSVREAGYGVVFGGGTHIFYTRCDAAWRQYQVWVHRIGANPGEDTLLYEEKDEKFSVEISASKDRRRLVVGLFSVTSSQCILFDLYDPWQGSRIVFERRAGVEYTVEPCGDSALIVHNLHRPDFSLSQTRLGDVRMEAWESVYVPEDGEQIGAVYAFSDFAVCEMRAEGETQLRVLRKNTDVPPEDGSKGLPRWSAPQKVTAPRAATVGYLPAGEWEDGEFLCTLESILIPPTVLCVKVAGENSALVCETLKTVSVPLYSPENYTEYRVWARADDGTKIPLTVAHRKDVTPNGTNAGILYGYGSYGISSDPWFSPALLPVLDRGAVYAAAHVRGGGELGRHWYEQGKLLQKRNTFTDFIAAAKYLVQSGLVDPKRLAAEGRSAGGLLMGAVANMAPEMFRVIHAGVPFVDALNTILRPDLPLTVGEWEEWGDPLHSAQVYRYMKSYSPYENIREKEYPAILATSAVNDVRVSCVEPLKWVARLRDTVRSDLRRSPVLLRTETAGGHGGGSGRQKSWENRSHELAFILSLLNAA